MIRRIALIVVLVVTLAAACTAEPTIEREARLVATPSPVPELTAAPEAPVETAQPTPPPTGVPPTQAPVPTSPPTLLPPSPEPVAPEPTVPVVSDAVPTTQELLDIGLTPSQAECFITTIDPEGTGRVESAERFLEALSDCT